jgi:hypothetical protein
MSNTRVYRLIHDRLLQLFKFIPNNVFGYLIGYKDEIRNVTVVINILKCLSCSKGVLSVTNEDIQEVKAITPGGIDVVGVYLSHDWYNSNSNVNDWWESTKNELSSIISSKKSGFIVITGGTNGTEYHITKDLTLSKQDPSFFNTVRISTNPDETISDDTETFYTAYVEGEWQFDHLDRDIGNLNQDNLVYEVDGNIIQVKDNIRNILSNKSNKPNVPRKESENKKKKKTLGDVVNQANQIEQNPFTFAPQVIGFQLYIKQFAKSNENAPKIRITLNREHCPVIACALCYIPVSLADHYPIANLLTTMLRTRLEYIQQQLNKRVSMTIRVNQAPQLVAPTSISSHVFLPDKYPHAFCLSYAWYDPSGDQDEETLQKHAIAERERLHDRFYFSTSRPFLRAQNAIDPSLIGSSSSLQVTDDSMKLRNVHLNCGAATGVDGGRVHLVKGDYTYYHYLQDGFSDDGWGCAYRSLQTLVSHAQSAGLATCTIPTHAQIQQSLVECGDKPQSFVGGDTWIGAFELSLVMRKWCGVSCRVLNVSSGRDMDDYARQLAAHFDQHGTPVMIGGGVLAYTLLGICFNESSGAVSYLILDPHYTGRDEIGPVIKGNWCAWKKREKVFLNNEFYNLCMPLLPKCV